MVTKWEADRWDECHWRNGYAFVYRPDFPGLSRAAGGYVLRSRVVYWLATGQAFAGPFQYLRRRDRDRSNDRLENLKPWTPYDIPGQRRCVHCGESKLPEKFWKRGNGRLLAYCIDCGLALANANQREAKARATELILSIKAGEACTDCGVHYPPTCMDFDHVRGVKSGNVSELTSRRWKTALKTVLAEIRKCELVCANCHRVRTAQRRQVDWAPDDTLPETTSVPLPPAFEDSRGVLQPLLFRPCGSVVVMNCTPGSVRAEHYHLTDWHYTFVISGSVDYYERDHGIDAVRKQTFGPGEMFFTPPLADHAMHFTAESVVVVMSNRHRTQELYEADLVRLAPDKRLVGAPKPMIIELHPESETVRRL